jgi:hypothetical protein
VQALLHARDRLPPFLNEPDPAHAIVSQVMGLFAFLASVPPPASCPYSQQLQQWQLPTLAPELHAAILFAAGLPAASSLHECVRMGTQAIAPLLKCTACKTRPRRWRALASRWLFHCECCRYAVMLKAQERQVWANPQPSTSSCATMLCRSTTACSCAPCPGRRTRWLTPLYD